MALRRVFSSALQTVSRSASLLLICSRCGAATKATTTPKKPRKTKADSPVKKLGEIELSHDQQVQGEKNVAHNDSEGARGDRASLLELAQREKNIFTAGKAYPGEMYIGKESLADRIADLMSISPEDDCFVLEGNPGMGLLSQAILDRGARKLRVLENRAVFVLKLQALQKRYGQDRLEIVCPYNVYDYRRKSAKKSDKLAMETLGTVISPPPLLQTQSLIEAPTLELRFEELINRGRQSVGWSSAKPALKYVGVVPERIENVFMQRIVNNTAKRKGFANLGRPEFFLVISRRQEAMITVQPGPSTSFATFRWVTVVLQSLFDIDVLHTVSRNELLPPVPKKHKQDDEWCVIRLTAKPNLPELLDWSLLPEYVFFVNQALTSRSKPLILCLEGWIPGFGRRLLDEGKTLYMRTGDLSAQDYLAMFQRISASREYADSTLRLAFLSSGQMEEPDEDEEDDQTVAKI